MGLLRHRLRTDKQNDLLVCHFKKNYNCISIQPNDTKKWTHFPKVRWRLSFELMNVSRLGPAHFFKVLFLEWRIIGLLITICQKLTKPPATFLYHIDTRLSVFRKKITWNFSGNSLKFQEMNVVCQSYSQPVIFFTDILYSLQFRHQTRWISNSFTSVSYQIGGSMFLWKQNHIEAGQGKSEVIWETLTTQEQCGVVMSPLHCHFSLFKYNNLRKH